MSSQLRPWESHKRQIESLESCSFLSKHCLQYPFVPVSKCSNKWTINCLKKDFLNVPSSCSHSRSREEPSAWDRSLESVVVCPELLELCPSPEIQNTQQLKHFIISPVVIWIFLPITKQSVKSHKFTSRTMVKLLLVDTFSKPCCGFQWSGLNTR